MNIKGMTEHEVLGYALMGLEVKRAEVAAKVAEIQEALGVRRVSGAMALRPADARRTRAKDAKIKTKRAQRSVAQHSVAQHSVAKKHAMSAAGRKAVAAAQRARWAAFHAKQKVA